MAKNHTSRANTSQRMAAKYAKKNKPMSPETKKRLMIILPIVAVIIIAAIVVISLIPDGSLKVRGGAVVGAEDNWLIVNTKTTNRPKYFKLAEVEAIDGFTVDAENSYSFSSDKNVTDFWIDNNDETAAEKYYAVLGVTHPASEVAENAFSLLGSYGAEMLTDSVVSAEINGTECLYYAYFMATPVEEEEGAAAEEATETEGEELPAEEENADPLGTFTIVSYFPALHDCSILVTGGSNEMLRSEGPDEAEMLSWIEQAFAGITIEQEAKK